LSGDGKFPDRFLFGSRAAVKRMVEFGRKESK
jgi:hypothetical protein